MKRTDLGALALASWLQGCRAVWGLGEAPERLADGGGAAGEGEVADVGSGAGGAAVGEASGGGGDDGVRPAFDGRCGGCARDADCGAAPLARCDDDGRCSRAVWSLSARANAFGEGFAVSDQRIAAVIDEGSADEAGAPRRDNAVAIVDRTTGALITSSLAVTSLGATAITDEGAIAYATRGDDGTDASLFTVDDEAHVSPWPGAPPGLALRGLRAIGDAFLATTDGSSGDRLIRFDSGDFAPCDASRDTLPEVAVWAPDVAGELVFAGGTGTSRALAHLPTPVGCAATMPDPTAVASVTAGTPIAVAQRGPVVAWLLRDESAQWLELMDTDGGVTFTAASDGGRALLATERGFYAMRGGALVRFGADDPTDVVPVAAVAGLVVMDLRARGDALFALALDSNTEATLVCVPEP